MFNWSQCHKKEELCISCTGCENNAIYLRTGHCCISFPEESPQPPWTSPQHSAETDTRHPETIQTRTKRVNSAWVSTKTHSCSPWLQIQSLICWLCFCMNQIFSDNVSFVQWEWQTVHIKFCTFSICILNKTTENYTALLFIQKADISQPDCKNINKTVTCKPVRWSKYM